MLSTGGSQDILSAVLNPQPLYWDFRNVLLKETFKKACSFLSQGITGLFVDNFVYLCANWPSFDVSLGKAEETVLPGASPPHGISRALKELL